MEAVDFELLSKQIQALVEDQPHWLCALANTSALLWEELTHINWVGFYVRGDFVNQALPEDMLVLGPFQGKVACTSIPWGKGVCGTAAAQDATQRVDNVHTFPGHIACDSASASELVIPLHVNGAVVAVLDIDSPIPARFTQLDQKGLEAVARIVEQVMR